MQLPTDGVELQRLRAVVEVGVNVEESEDLLEGGHPD